MTLPGSHASPSAHLPEQRARDITASLHAALRELPSRTWITSCAEAYESLGSALDSVLKGSSRQEPEAVVSTLRQVQQLLTEAGQHVQVSVSEVRQYAARIGGGGIDENAPSWGAARPEQAPSRPEPTMASLAEFVRGARTALSPQILPAAVDALDKCRAQLGSSSGNITTPDELRAAMAECAAAAEKFRTAAQSVMTAQKSLDEYTAAALGNATVHATVQS